MSLRISLIDGSQGYRRILGAFIHDRWPDAKIEDIDPFSQTMRGAGLAFGGASDLIILGGIGTRAEAMTALERIGKRNIPVILLVSHEMQPESAALIEAGAAAVLIKDALSRATLLNAIARATSEADELLPASGFGQYEFAIDGERHVVGIEHYQEAGTLASTAMSKLFLARRTGDDQRAVVKIAHSWPYHNDVVAQYFCDRYGFFSAMNGNGVTQYLDAGIAGPWPYVVIEHLPGGDLRQRMTAAGVANTAPLEALRLLVPLAKTLTHIHEGGFVHLDVKPENIMYRADSELVLIDYNISTRIGEVARDRVTNDILGSPDYMSPEQGQGLPVDGRSDLYSIGVILYEMLAGERPYLAKNSAELIFKHIHDEIPLLPKAVREFQPLVDSLMAKHADERISSGAELVQSLHACLGSAEA
ncbi:MAG: serine/threonine protein kinase [Betaproteobacteria bacterium]|nr:serine/threonine protein kinase [Betaproteobacteria bacterium]